MNVDGRIVIVGGGPAGLAAARAYREGGGHGNVIIFTKENFAPYNRPPLTKEFLRGEVGRDTLPIEEERWFGENGVELRLATAVGAFDPDRGVVETEGGEEVPYDSLVLATGSEPIRIPIPGGDDPEVLVMRTIEDSERLQARVQDGDRAVVVGSGFIGCEAAASLSLRGARVTLVSQEDTPQETRLGTEVGRRITSWLKGYGVDLRLGVDVEGVERRNGGFGVGIAGGETIETGTVLFGTGVKPRTGLAEDAGLEIEGGGVVTDSSMRTSAPGVFAVGDIAYAMNDAAGSRQKVEHWGDALEHGRVAGTVLAGGEAAYRIAPGFWSTVGDKTLKYWSWSGGWDETRFVDHGGGAFTAWYGLDGTTVGVLTYDHDADYEEGYEIVVQGEPLPG